MLDNTKFYRSLANDAADVDDDDDDDGYDVRAGKQMRVHAASICSNSRHNSVFTFIITHLTENVEYR